MPQDARSPYPTPPIRRLRVYAFDPQASTRLDTASVNVATIKLPWETAHEDALKPGPINDYLEVIDVDPVSDQFYDAVDLNDPHLLAQDGLAPSEGDPRFHQQMTFAVAMKTIRTFERALGRRIFWAPTKIDGAYVETPRLRIYPHALREPNAYYSPDKKALLFGYFKASSREAGASWVFTALSHDIIVHETTHAILDGLHRRFAEATSVDSLAFHEAFADIVALLSHFTLEEAVRAEISAKGGRLDERSLMSGLARQFGQAAGGHGALRAAIEPKVDGQPDATLLGRLSEPHDRGAILVAAVFDAFVAIYQQRTADLLRIADVRLDPQVRRTLHPDLVSRLAREASKSAEHVLRMCIRALDYLPPVDVRFGEFLRAIVTADADLVPDDALNYRLAMIEGFRRRGILPEDCLSLAPDSLMWEAPLDDALRLDELTLSFRPMARRDEAMEFAEKQRKAVHDWIMKPDNDPVDRVWQSACGIVFREGLVPGDDRRTIVQWPAPPGGAPPQTQPKVEIHSVRASRRAGPDGQELQQVIIEVTQRRRGFRTAATQDSEDQYSTPALAAPDFIFRGGATLIFDLQTRKIRYAIRKRISDDERLRRQREFFVAYQTSSFGFQYGLAERNASGEIKEPFALLHRGA